MFVRSYLDTAATIIDLYNGAEPLAYFLKRYFAANKKFGSRDRKQISQLVYAYFRTGRSLQGNRVEDQLLAALFLCSTTSQPILQHLKPEWNEHVDSSFHEKIATLGGELAIEPASIFPFISFLSPQIDPALFAQSFLVQPDTFLRLRPGREQVVLQQLEAAGIDWKSVSAKTLMVPPAAKLDDLVMMDRDLVVQDKSSQQVLSLLAPFANLFEKPFAAWDCCAASGGKSILLRDTFPAAKITVSDIRPSILHNLRKRFERAGITNFHAFVGDLSDSLFTHKPSYDLVICDAPCSGSGTWGRTPEWLRYFTEEKLNHYANLQQKIATKASENVAPGGFFLYITCSVFSRENEDIVSSLQSVAGLELVQMQYFTGYREKADTLFAALFRR